MELWALLCCDAACDTDVSIHQSSNIYQKSEAIIYIVTQYERSLYEYDMVKNNSYWKKPYLQLSSHHWCVLTFQSL